MYKKIKLDRKSWIGEQYIEDIVKKMLHECKSDNGIKKVEAKLAYVDNERI